MFPEDAWTQICLPFEWSGFGMRGAAQHSSGAYLASVANAAALDGWDASEAEGWAEAAEDVCARTGWGAEQVRPDQPLNQKAVSAAIDQAMFKALLAAATPFNKARLLSASGKGAGAWLGVIPSAELGYVFDPREFTTLLRFWVGMPVYDAARACPGCGTAMDVYGYHALTCTHLGGLGVRHNALRDVWLKFFKLAGVPAQAEAPSLLPGSAARPADIFVPDFVPPDAKSATPACLDFAISHPQQPNFIKRAGEECGFAAKEYADKVKVVKFGAECEAAGVLLVPMVVETFGRWGACSEEMFCFISKASAARGNVTAQRAVAFLRRSLAVCLQRSNVCTLLGRLDRNAPVLDQPVELSLELPEDGVFADDVRELLLEGCQCVAGGACEC